LTFTFIASVSVAMVTKMALAHVQKLVFPDVCYECEFYKILHKILMDFNLIEIDNEYAAKGSSCPAL
jgi:hypothetical protein